MKKIILSLFALLLLININVTRGQLLLPYNGNNYFLNGINIPWHMYDNDFGTHYLFGANYNSAFFDSVFTQCEAYGVNCVRVWLHTDGATSPEWDSLGYVTGVDTNFYSNLDDFFQLAENHNIMVIPVIWSFEMMNNDYAQGQYGGMHASLIQDTLKTRSYISNVLDSMVTHYKDQCNLLAWEIINEPEWATDVQDNDPDITQHVSMSEMQRFVGMLAEAIHQHSSKMCTVGSASIKYNSDVGSFPTTCVGNFWKDAAIQAAYNKPLAHLDIYEVHYYDWMHAVYANYDPYDYSFSYWGLDKFTIIGESKGTSTNHTPAEQLYNSFIGNYSGVLFWSFVGGDGNGDFSTVKTDLLNFRNAGSSFVDFTGCITTSTTDPKNSLYYFQIYPNPSSEYANIVAPLHSTVEISNIQGQIIKSFISIDDHTSVDLKDIASGLYIVRIKTDQRILTKRLIKE